MELYVCMDGYMYIGFYRVGLVNEDYVRTPPKRPTRARISPATRFGSAHQAELTPCYYLCENRTATDIPTGATERALWDQL